MSSRGVIISNSPDIGEFDLGTLVQGYDFVIALDGAANSVPESVPLDVVCGDFDSIDPSIVKAAHPFANLIALPDQNANDLEKGIEYLRLRGINHLCILHGWSGRVDQMFATLSILLRFHVVVDIFVRSKCEEVRVLSPAVGEFQCRCTIGDPFSILSLSEDACVTARGLRWELDNETVPAGSLGVSNVCTSEEVAISVTRGIVVVVHTIASCS